jgi:hypothetical protein
VRGDVRGRHEVLEIPEPFCLRGLLAVAEFDEGLRRVLDEGDVVDDARTLGSMGNVKIFRGLKSDTYFCVHAMMFSYCSLGNRPPMGISQFKKAE